MAKVLIKVNVPYLDEFLETFESQAADRRRKGEHQYSSIGVDENCHNLAYVIADWTSINSAKTFWLSSEAEKQKEDWKAKLTEVTILQESPDD
jgi:hypothetical protein